MRMSPTAILEAPTRFREFAHKRTADFWLFESSLWLHVFASSLISIFIPILLLTNGFSVRDVLLFYIFYHLFNVPANYLGRYIVAKYSAKVAIIIGTIFIIGFFIVYSNVATWTDLLLMASLYAIYDGLYYTASLYLFISSTKDPENTGENTGILHLVIRSAGLLGPIVGSTLILVSGGSRAVIVTVVVLFFLFSLIPLFLLKELGTGKPERFIPFKEFFSNKREVKNHLSYALFKIHETTELILFPMFIFITFMELSSVAVLAILIPVVSLLFSYTASHIKRSQRERIIMFGALALAGVWITRFFIDTQLMFYATNVLTGLFALFVLVPLDANIFHRAAERGALSASMYRNMIAMGAKALFYIVLFIITEAFAIPFTTALLALVGLAFVNYSYMKWREKQPGEQTSIVGQPSV